MHTIRELKQKLTNRFVSSSVYHIGPYDHGSMELGYFGNYLVKDDESLSAGYRGSECRDAMMASFSNRRVKPKYIGKSFFSGRSRIVQKNMSVQKSRN